MTHSSVKLNNIIDLTKQHHHISKQFNTHQILLMNGDSQRAYDILTDLKNFISSHIKAENDYLLPLYEKRVSPIPLGGAVEFFIHEHHKINRFLEEFLENSSKFKSHIEGSKPEIVKLFDQHYIFKHLLDHHHTREDTFLFRYLDKELDGNEKKEVMKQFSF